jgi:hypothetical protein
MNIDIISDDVLVARVDGGVLAAIEREKGKKGRLHLSRFDGEGAFAYLSGIQSLMPGKALNLTIVCRK